MQINYEPGHKLPNGATVMLFHRLPELPGLLPAGVVLAYEPGGKQFVTWVVVQPNDRDDYCIEGQYRRDVVDAIGDYLERCGDKRGAALKSDAVYFAIPQTDASAA